MNRFVILDTFIGIDDETDKLVEGRVIETSVVLNPNND